MTQISLYCSIVGFILVTIIVLVMGRGQYNPSSLVSNQGISGWGLGPAWLMSIGIGQYPFFGTGACTHVAEEIPRPGRKLPLIM
jgi:choline transport protein